MKRINIVLFVGLIFLISCTKDNDYPKKYTRVDFISGDVRLFTNAGEVTDKEQIVKFVNGVKRYAIARGVSENIVNSFDVDLNFMSNDDIEILFTSATKGVFRTKYNADNEYESIEFNLIDKEGYSLLSLNKVVRNIYEQDPIFKCSPEFIGYGPLPGGLGISEFKYPFYIKKNGDEILFCITSFMEKCNNSNNTLRKMRICGATNNLINEEYLNELQSPSRYVIDSVAFKESYIRFK